MASITHLTRIEPRGKGPDFPANFAAHIHDPLWFLTRQWQMGEFLGEDAGSLAFVEYEQSSSVMASWRPSANPTFESVDQSAPLERQTLNEPFEPDLATAVELGHDFADALRLELGDETAAAVVLDAFGALPAYRVDEIEDTNPVNPIDPATKRFLMVCAGRVVNGVTLYELGVAIANGSGSVPSEVSSDPALVAQIEAALAALVAQVRSVFGDVANVDPRAWRPEQLEYQLEVAGAHPSGDGTELMRAYPNSDGEFEWFSFDVSSHSSSGSSPLPTTVTDAMIPTRVRFSGMPSTRYWNFEQNRLPLPRISAEADDIVKLLVLNYMGIHSHDWYVFPTNQATAAMTRTNYVVVHDVFGQQIVVRRADAADPPSTGLRRWTMFSISDASTPSGLSDYFILPPSAGPAMQLGSVLEDVRFGRDEMANMAWAIERVTTSPVGEPRRGRERNAQVDERLTPSEPVIVSNFPLRYVVESEIPCDWIPLIPVQTDPASPSIALRRAAVLKDIGAGDPATVPALSSIMNPTIAQDHYDIPEEEIPRSGLRIERIVYRTRWIDGSTHLWVQRRRRIGAGESQSGLQFDQAISNPG